MANSPSKVVLIAAAVMGIGAMVLLNTVSQKMTPKTEEQEMQEQQAQQKAPPASQAASQGAAGKGGTVPAPRAKPSLHKAGEDEEGKASSLVGLGENKVVGSATAGPDVTIRYAWTPEVQSDPKKVYDAVSAVKNAMPNARIHVINTDEQPGAANGLYVGSDRIAPAAADGSITVNPAMLKAVLGSGAR